MNCFIITNARLMQNSQNTCILMHFSLYCHIGGDGTDLVRMPLRPSSDFRRPPILGGYALMNQNTTIEAKMDHVSVISI